MTGLNIHYFTNDRGTCEIDLRIDNGTRVVPVNVKAEQNLTAKRLKTFRAKYDPEIAVRTSTADYKKEDGLTDLPLYAVENIVTEIS